MRDVDCQDKATEPRCCKGNLWQEALASLGTQDHTDNDYKIRSGRCHGLIYT